MPKDSKSTVDYQQFGFVQAAESGSGLNAFKLGYLALFNDFYEEGSVLINTQEVEDEIAYNEGLIVKMNGVIENIRREVISTLDADISKCNFLKKKIRLKPDSFDFDKPSFTKICLGGSVLIFTSIYLWVFYSSSLYFTIYSSSLVSDLQHTLFNPNIFFNAQSSGISALIIITLIPFVFLGLSYSVLCTIKESRSRRSQSLYMASTTYIVHCLLAYSVAMKTYAIRELNQDMEFLWYELFIHPEFLLTIILGYGAYAIWMIIIFPVIDEFKKINGVKYKISLIRKDISHFNKLKEHYFSVKEGIANDIALTADENIVLKELLRSAKCSFSDFKAAGDNYLKGWDNYNADAGLELVFREEQLKWFQDELDRLREDVFILKSR